jgi:hypothetical protein
MFHGPNFGLGGVSAFFCACVSAAFTGEALLPAAIFLGLLAVGYFMSHAADIIANSIDKSIANAADIIADSIDKGNVKS